jgi:hypothetical protein
MQPIGSTVFLNFILAASTSRPFKLNKRSQFFIGVHNEPPSVAAMCARNPDCSSTRIHGRDTAQTPTGFAEMSAMISTRALRYSII